MSIISGSISEIKNSLYRIKPADKVEMTKAIETLKASVDNEMNTLRRNTAVVLLEQKIRKLNTRINYLNSLEKNDVKLLKHKNYVHYQRIEKAIYIDRALDTMSLKTLAAKLGISYSIVSKLYSMILKTKNAEFERPICPTCGLPKVLPHNMIVCHNKFHTL
jgi:hypothetical protein